MSAVTHTIGSILKVSEEWLAQRGVDQPKVDAGTLLAKALGMKRLDLYLQTDRPLAEHELAAFRPLLQRRGRREPVSKIIGSKGFWNHDFLVTPDVLSPRSDSELLVELGLKLEVPAAAQVLDLCTGSGCLAISLAAERPDWSVIATDISREALEVARRNGQHCLPDQPITWLESDVFCALDQRFDLIVTNPPYVGESEREDLDPEVKLHDPSLALFSGEDGLHLIRQIVAQAPKHLSASGWLLIEHGYTQGEPVRRLMTERGFSSVESRRDLGQRERVTLGCWSSVDQGA